jgi:hypothetical protein
MRAPTSGRPRAQHVVRHHRDHQDADQHHRDPQDRQADPAIGDGALIIRHDLSRGRSTDTVPAGAERVEQGSSSFHRPAPARSRLPQPAVTPGEESLVAALDASLRGAEARKAGDG